MLTWIEISRSALNQNIKALRNTLDGQKLLAVVKANAYGHDMNLVAKTIESKVDWFGCASLQEALELSRIVKRKPILVISFFDTKDKESIKQAIKKQIRLPIYTLSQLESLESAAKNLSKKALVHIKVDTGTSRVGLRPENFSTFYQSTIRHRHLEIEGLFSHFADSEEDSRYTSVQLQKLLESQSKIDPGKDLVRHIACSAATVLHPQARLEMVRTGIMLYGMHPSKKTRQKPKASDYVGRHIVLQPALTWKARIIQVKDLPKGTYVGYGLTYRAARKIKMAVLPVGYSDGYPRRLSNNSYVLINGKKAPVIGRVCMNMIMVDATATGAKEGDEAVLLGAQKKERITAQELALKVGTINYEIVSRLSPKILRKLVR